tara:strand:+ start:1246 stop:2118 length:873 start_codon:yes stop_codon:yes gene_type:complete
MATSTIRNRNDIKIIFLADFFRSDLLGGGECNDAVLINHILDSGYTLTTQKCSDLSAHDFKKNNFFIVGNFISLSEENKKLLQDEKYIIYEHDHKYIKSRDPSVYKDFLAPTGDIINHDFYRNALGVVVLSRICKEIIEKNLNINNVYNIGCSLWSDKKLNFIESLCNNPKNDKLAIIGSSNPIKNTALALQYCKKQNIEHAVIGPCEEKKLLEELSHYKGLVFLPQVLETFSRISAEAKMLNCKLLTKPKLLGFASEDIYSLSGIELITQMRKRKKTALSLFIRLIEGD